MAPAASRPIRAIVLADDGGRVHRVTLQRKGEANWAPEREIAIDYDVPVPPERIAARLPEGARVIDRDRIFEDRYPLDRAISRVEVGGLILAVHDVRPLKDREGFFVVSSVRGTSEHLRRFPPRRRPINAEVSVLEVATQPTSNRMLGGKYDLIGMGSAAREGVEFSWWMVVPRRFYRLKDGQEVYEPESGLSALPGEPGRLDDLAGRARIPLAATYDDPAHRDPNGMRKGVTRWAEVPLPADQPPTTLEEVAARTRRDLSLMRHAGIYALLGVAADAKAERTRCRPLSHFEPDAIGDAGYAASVRRGLEDLRALDKLGDVLLPGASRPN